MRREFRKWLVVILGGVTFMIVGTRVAMPQVVDIHGLASLKTVAVREPSNLNEFVVNRSAAIQLGKALFWDVQVGSDGNTACATCHFHAGADNRTKNQLSPGILAGDTTFQVSSPNHELQASDFPIQSNDVVSSQGVFRRDFVDVPPARSRDVSIEQCQSVADSVFHVGTTNVRRVEPRNTPSAVNAIFNFRNFWDGRANSDFNGVNPFGQRDPNARIWKLVNGQLERVPVVIPLSSLASQAVGPPGSFFEMSCAGRSFMKIGQKLLSPTLTPLAKQHVHPTDSVLGAIARSRTNSSAKGLALSYADLIKQAFWPAFWSATQPVPVSAAEMIQAQAAGSDLRGAERQVGVPSDYAFNQMEANFSLFFGLAVQLYEATLLANDTSVDLYLEGNTGALSLEQLQGLAIFTGRGGCVNCHGGAELTNASVSHVLNERMERMHMGDGGIAVYDNGFYNIGVRPTNDDIGIGGTDPFGQPLSQTAYCQQRLQQPSAGPIDPVCTDPIPARPDEQITAAVLGANERIAVRGSHKTPGLRNVELTGPYFHNGSKATLRQVVDFYDRGGDFAQVNRNDLDPNIGAIGLSETEKRALVAFLIGLTDERVRWERAPFDRPELCIPNGQVGDRTGVTADPFRPGDAKDEMRCLPAVGADGASVPIQTFLVVSPFQP